jgi:hypothetical protein
MQQEFVGPIRQTSELNDRLFGAAVFLNGFSLTTRSSQGRKDEGGRSESGFRRT